MNYRRINIVVLVALLALWPLLWLVPWLRSLLGGFYPGCVLEQLAEHPCPLCGLTTSLRNLFTGHVSAAPVHPLTIPAVALIGIELVARAALAALPWSASALARCRRGDLRLHAALLLLYLLYCAAYFGGGIG